VVSEHPAHRQGTGIVIRELLDRATDDVAAHRYAHDVRPVHLLLGALGEEVGQFLAGEHAGADVEAVVGV
jgi:hypothetical protein